jgi:hypothetical protein
MLALLGGIGGRCEHESRGQGGSEDFKWKRHDDPPANAQIRLTNDGSGGK